MSGTQTPQEIANEAREAAQTLMDLAGYGNCGGLDRVRTSVVSRRRIDGALFHTIEIEILGYDPSRRLFDDSWGKTVRAAIAAASAEVDAPLSLVPVFRR